MFQFLKVDLYFILRRGGCVTMYIVTYCYIKLHEGHSVNSFLGCDLDIASVVPEWNRIGMYVTLERTL